jgi:antiviral helicase SKI2
MAHDLAQVVEALHLQGQGVNDNEDSWIEASLKYYTEDDLNQVKLRRSVPKGPEVIKRELEEELLSPPTEFSARWLNKLQQRWDAPVNYVELAELAPTQTRTITRFTREGLEGRVTGYKEVSVPASSANAKNSTSLLRRPANRADFVRGAAGFFPFVPGGLDGVDAIAEFENQAQVGERGKGGTKSDALDRIINFGTEGGLLKVAPGFIRGLKFAEKKVPADDGEAQEVENTLDEVRPTAAHT